MRVHCTVQPFNMKARIELYSTVYFHQQLTTTENVSSVGGYTHAQRMPLTYMEKSRHPEFCSCNVTSTGLHFCSLQAVFSLFFVV